MRYLKKILYWQQKRWGYIIVKMSVDLAITKTKTENGSKYAIINMPSNSISVDEI